MRPEQQDRDGPGDLFRARLDRIINLRHELVQLADRIDWNWIDSELADPFNMILLTERIHGHAEMKCVFPWTGQFMFLSVPSCLYHVSSH